MFSKFFIDRPIFAKVLAVVIVLLGGVAIFMLPIDRYPQIVPPAIRITANYPGADAETLAQSVAGPIEEQLSGARNLMYFSSTSANNGTLTITATFEIGTNQDLAAVEVQNRLSIATPRLPQEVTRQGITVTKASTNILAVATLESTDPRYDDIYLSNYAQINLIDALRRVPGVGDAQVFGAKNYAMRLWMNPDKLSRVGMTVTDVATAVREQNAVFAAGTIGQRPSDGATELTLPVLTSGRLDTAEQYRKIILRAFPDGRVITLGEVAEIELGAQSYDTVGRVNGKPNGLILIYLQNDANALTTIASVRKTLDDAAKSFPHGVSYRIPYDTTTFIEESISEVVKTLAEAVALVLIVVFLFLQSWRATLIPLLAVPVAVIGTFAGMLMLGFSINTLTLFGLVLAIGIVVDDAIVVVENVERLMHEERLSPYDATVKAMHQVSGALVAIVLVLTAVFVPVAFVGGLTGQLYKQFAVTIAVSVGISGLVALTLSPALCRLLLKPHHGERKKFILFRWFDQAFGYLTEGYSATVRGAIKFVVPTLILFVGLVLITLQLSNKVPSGFLPDEDQGYFIAVVQLPDGRSLDKTDALVRDVESFLAKQPEVENVVMLEGFDLLTGGTNSPSSATMFVRLRAFGERKGAESSSQAMVTRTMGEFRKQREGLVIAINPPPIQGLSQQAGFQLELQSRTGASIAELAETTEKFLAQARTNPAISPAIRGTLRLSVPQLFVTLDRERTKMLGVRISDVFDTMQALLGSLYVNDFNKFGRVWRVQLQAEPSFRDEPSDIDRIFVRSGSGGMVPLSALVQSRLRAGPNVVSRFNGYPSVQITGTSAPGRSSGESMAAVTELARTSLPPGFGFEWSGSSFQEVRAGNQAPLILVFGLAMVFLVLAAQYERWSLPAAVLLVVPLAILGALLATLFRGLVQDIYFQVGMLVLVGLSAKNAILIVEFASSLRRQGKSPREAAIEAARVRFRPIVMTSLAFIMGVVPLAIASGAGAAARHSIGTGVIGGMLAATFLGPIFVPVFFVLIETGSDYIKRRRRGSSGRPQVQKDEVAHVAHEPVAVG